MKRLSARCIAVLCSIACATIALVAARPAADRLRTDDRNGDGRPDVWRHYDAQGQPTEVDIDTNFDGRSDIQEYYERGVLVRRESDRDFNDQIDLVEDFDAATQQHVRTTIDLDYDGSADLLILFQDGRPAFSKRVSGAPAATRQASRSLGSASNSQGRRANDRLAPLNDPFRDDIAIRATRAASTGPGAAGLVTGGGLPAAAMDAVAPALRSARLVRRDITYNPLADPHSRSPRGPPVS